MKLIHSGIILGLAVAGVSAVACSGSKIASTGSSSTEGNTNTAGNVGGLGQLKGAISIASSGGTETINTVSWTITNSNGYVAADGGIYTGELYAGDSGTTVIGNTIWKGTINVSQSGHTNFTVGNLPPGTGYNIALSANTTDSAYTCVATEPFAVVAEAVANIQLVLACTPNNVTTGLGSVTINATQTIAPGCAVVTGVSDTPGDIILPATGTAYPISLAVAGVGSQTTDVVSYAWSLSSSVVGSLSATTGAAPTFTCLQPGSETITVTANVNGASYPGAAPDSGAACAGNSQSVVVTCEGTCSGSTPNQCGVSCTNTNTDTANCGACSHSCPATATETATCTAGVCGFTCVAPYDGATCTINKSNDPSNCGTVGNVCPTGDTCTNGTCSAPVLNVGALCAQALTNNAAGWDPVSTSQCSATELALFAHDLAKLGTTAATATQGKTPTTCLGCAYLGGYLDDTFSAGDINKECGDDVFGTVGSVAQCVAEVQCGVGVNSACKASSTPSQCTWAATSFQQPSSSPNVGTAVANLLCGGIAISTCTGSSEPVATLEASGGTCAAQWVAGTNGTGGDTTGLAAYNDGSGLGTASGFANSLLTYLAGPACVALCMQ